MRLMGFYIFLLLLPSLAISSSNQQMLISYGSSAPIVYATWNPSDKTASITLSGGNLIATPTSTAQGVRATIGKSSGKPQFEVNGGTNYSGIGVRNAGNTLAGFVGGTSGGLGYLNGGTIRFNNSTRATVATYTSGDIIT